jgi:TatD DNase family protein
MRIDPSALIDTHCHLTMNSFASDRRQVIERAQAAGLIYILVPGIDLESSQAAISLANDYPSIYAAVGVHPHHTAEWNAQEEAELAFLAKSKKVVAIGEIGLDYYRDLSPRSMQQHAFRSQLDIASELDLPVIIHNRQATKDILQGIRSWSSQADGKRKRGVLHAYSGDLNEAREAIDLEFNLGIAGPITFQNADTLRNMVTQLQLSDLVIETDSPYLAPHPYRGKRNEPAHVAVIAKELSRIHHCDYSQIAQTTTQNALRLFGWHNGTDADSLR